MASSSSSSSRFVSGGTTEQPTERDEAWLKAQAALDAKHVAAQQQKQQEGGKSLYETLQANKAAKQEAFEESIRLKNQFQSLNEDEVEFLDSVLEGERKKEETAKREMREQMEAFRRQREEAEKAERENTGTAPEVEEIKESWSTAGRKRKAAKERGAIAGVKIRRKSSTTAVEDETKDEIKNQAGTGENVKETTDRIASSPSQPSATTKPPVPPPAPSLGLGLAGYSSDEDDA